MRTRALLGRAGLVLAALGCGDDLAPLRDGGACRVDCAPYACAAGDACLRSCRTADQCAPEHVCRAGACVGTECTAETALQVCGPYACLNGNCADDCALGPCVDGFYCRGNDNQCVPRCTEPDDPICEGYLCNTEFGECEPYCDDELPCADGHECDQDGHCEP